MPRPATSSPSGEDLLAGCLRGEQAACDALVDRYAALINSIPLKYGFGAADAADAFQTVCVTLIEKLGTVREPGRLAAWLATTASRECLAVIRARRRELRGPGTRLLMGVPDPALPQVTGEIEALQALFGSALVLSGPMVTEHAFREHAPDADVIHLASHAVFRQDYPLFSAIRLAHGWLSLYDLYGLKLRASLVTLSACDTGMNDVLAGDELVGLTRGFFQAGAAAMVVGLWAVNDTSTAHVMQRFYRYLETGQGPAAAIRLAQGDLRREFPHPYYWAPFLVIGRP